MAAANFETRGASNLIDLIGLPFWPFRHWDRWSSHRSTNNFLFGGEKGLLLFNLLVDGRCFPNLWPGPAIAELGVSGALQSAGPGQRFGKQRPSTSESQVVKDLQHRTCTVATFMTAPCKPWLDKFSSTMQVSLDPNFSEKSGPASAASGTPHCPVRHTYSAVWCTSCSNLSSSQFEWPYDRPICRDWFTHLPSNRFLKIFKAESKWTWGKKQTSFLILRQAMARQTLHGHRSSIACAKFRIGNASARGAAVWNSRSISWYRHTLAVAKRKAMFSFELEEGNDPCDEGIALSTRPVQPAKYMAMATSIKTARRLGKALTSAILTKSNLGSFLERAQTANMPSVSSLGGHCFTFNCSCCPFQTCQKCDILFYTTRLPKKIDGK